MIEENNNSEQEFEEKISKLLSESAEVDYPPSLHKRAIFAFESSVKEKPNRFGSLLRFFGASGALALVVFGFIFYSGSLVNNRNSYPTKIASVSSKTLPVSPSSQPKVQIAKAEPDKSAVSSESLYISVKSGASVLATNMTEGSLDEVSEEEVGAFYKKLAEYRKNSGRGRTSVIYIPASPEVDLASDR